MIKQIFKSVLLTGILLVQASTLQASDAASTAWKALQNGEAVLLMRHAYAPDTNEASPYHPEKCAGQRNLSEAGVKQAAAVAITLRNKGINKATVYSSSLCRCIDTGITFGYGDVLNLPEIDTYYGEEEAIGVEQTAALKQWIKRSVSEKSGPAILITHGLNISDLMGGFLAQGGVMIIGVEKGELVNLHEFSTAY